MNTSRHSDAPRRSVPTGSADLAQAVDAGATAAEAPSVGGIPDAATIRRTVVSLHRKLGRNVLKQHKSQWVMIIMIWAYGVFATIGLAMSMYGPISEGATDRLAIPLCTGVVAYWMLALFYPTSESQLGADWFASFPVTAKDLLPGFFLASIWQSRGYLVIVNSLITFAAGGVALVEAGHPIAVAGWAVAVIVSAILCFLGGEALSSVGSGFTKSRKNRERFAAMAGIGITLIIVVFNLVINNTDKVPVEALSTVTSWSPMAGVAGAVNAGIHGHWLVMVAQLILGVILIPIFVRLWLHTTSIQLTTVTEISSGADTKTKGSVVFPPLPKTPVGALTGRYLMYLKRDTRQIVGLIVMPLFIVVFLVMGMQSNNPGMLWMPMYFVAVFGAQLLANTVGVDGPSNWLHIVAGTRARDLLLSRVIVAGILIIPIWLLAAGVLGIARDFDGVWLIAAVTCAAANLVGMGMGLVLAVVNPFPMAKPGTNPYKDRSGTSQGAWIAMIASMLGMWIPLIPGLVMVTIGYTKHMPVLFDAGLVVEMLTGLVMLFLGFSWARVRLDATWPEVLAKVGKYV